MKDKRYTVTTEYAGYKDKSFVVRFCGEFISAHATKLEAQEARIKFKEERERKL